MVLDFLKLPLDDKDDASCATFVLVDEDHTLGNALRWMLMKKLAVDSQCLAL